jgi:hypothetical protein
VSEFYFLLASSLTIKLYYFFFLLLVVLSDYSKSPYHAKPPISLDAFGVTVCPNSSSAQLGVSAPVLPQNESLCVLALSGMLCVLTLSGVFNIVLPQNEVFKIVTVNYQLSNKVKSVICSLLNVSDRHLGYPVETLVSLCHFKWTLTYLTGLIHALHSNGPLHQVRYNK